MFKRDFQAVAAHDFYKPTSADYSLSDWPPSLTRQEFAEECDINEIMRRFERGEQPSFTPRVPLYLDLTEMPETLQETLNMLSSATDSFMSLPAVVRREFDNDAVKFVEYASDPTNLDQLRAWGLAPPPPEAPPPQRVEIVNPPQAPQEPPKTP